MMLKLISRAEAKTLPDPRDCYRLKHYAQMLFIGGFPMGASILIAAILNAPMWLLAVFIVTGCAWYGIVGLVVADRARELYIQELKQDPCPNCGYSLTGLPVPQCPECGVIWSPWDPPKDTTHDCNQTSDKPDSQV